MYAPFDSKEDITESTTRQVKSMLKELDGASTTPIVMCAFPGLDLLKVNNNKAVGHHPQQDILNEAMIEINDYITELNLCRGFSTPMLSAAVHRCHGRTKEGMKKYRHHYCRLTDGLHPSSSTLNYWTKRLEEDFKQFIFNYEEL